MTRPDTPPTVSARVPAELPFSDAAARNAPHILGVLRAWLPPEAAVLEIASGTGQHALHFAQAQPQWRWWPTEARPEALPVLQARCAGLAHVQAPQVLDVMAPVWPVPAAAFDAVVVANLLHISPWPATAAFFRGPARALRTDGCVAVYGPFAVPGEPLAPSNAAFDADLRARDARWGLRSLPEVQAVALAAGLRLAERCDMPAHNLLLRWVPVRGFT